MQKAAQAYFQTQVQTTSQGQLLLMLYDGAIKFLKQAKVKIEERNYAKKGILISKAIDVISELDSSLNPEKGGDLATNLHNLYFFCNTRLLQANMKMDTKLIDDVIDILSGLREAYAQITENAPVVSQQPATQSTGQSSGKAASAAVETAGQNPANGKVTPLYPQKPAQPKAPPPGSNSGQSYAPSPPASAKPAPQQAQANGNSAPQNDDPRQVAAATPKKPAKPANNNASEASKPQNTKPQQVKPAQNPNEAAGPQQEQSSRRSLLAGANIYRRMSQQ